MGALRFPQCFAAGVNDPRDATFADAAGRDAHIGGEIARQLFAYAEELLVTAPTIDLVDLIATKHPA